MRSDPQSRWLEQLSRYAWSLSQGEADHEFAGIEPEPLDRDETECRLQSTLDRVRLPSALIRRPRTSGPAEKRSAGNPVLRRLIRHAMTAYGIAPAPATMIARETLRTVCGRSDRVQPTEDQMWMIAGVHTQACTELCGERRNAAAGGPGWRLAIDRVHARELLRRTLISPETEELDFNPH